MHGFQRCFQQLGRLRKGRLRNESNPLGSMHPPGFLASDCSTALSVTSSLQTRPSPLPLWFPAPSWDKHTLHSGAKWSRQSGRAGLGHAAQSRQHAGVVPRQRQRRQHANHALSAIRRASCPSQARRPAGRALSSAPECRQPTIPHGPWVGGQGHSARCLLQPCRRLSAQNAAIGLAVHTPAASTAPHTSLALPALHLGAREVGPQEPQTSAPARPTTPAAAAARRPPPVGAPTAVLAPAGADGMSDEKSTKL